MFLNGKTLTAVLGAAALSGTLLVPSSKLHASPAPETAAAPILASIQIASPAVLKPAVLSDEAKPAIPAPVTGPTSGQDESPDANREISERELDCLTKVVLYEAGAESRAGQLAVAHVVLNRTRSKSFPKSICGVIYQRGQFSSIRSFNPPRNARWERARGVARDAVDGGSSPIGKALYFHAASVSPAYVRSRPRVAKIGNHIFYR